MKKPLFSQKAVRIPHYPITLNIVIGYDSNRITDYISRTYYREDFAETFQDCSSITFAEPGRIIVVFDLKAKPKENLIFHESAHIVVKLFQMIEEATRPCHFIIYHLAFINDSILSFFKKHKLIITTYNY